MTFDEDVLLR